MINNDDKELWYVFAAAFLGAAATGLVTWGIDELRTRYGSKDK